MTRKADFSLAVQYASDSVNIPLRARFRRWVRAALETGAEIVIRIVDEAEGRELNRGFRGKDYATNVLTFVYDDQAIPLQGDIVLCAPVVEREALEQNKALEAHYAHLVVHGVLHLQGHDHEIEDEAEVMEAAETRIMVKLGYPDPYAA